MQGFINQAHGVERAGMKGALRVVFGVARLVDPLSKFTAGSEIGEDHVAGGGEESLVKLIEVADGARNVEFVGGKLAHLSAAMVLESWCFGADFSAVRCCGVSSEMCARVRAI